MQLTSAFTKLLALSLRDCALNSSSNIFFCSDGALTLRSLVFKDVKL